ncbi:uncharacterized protein LOC112344115 [Selaginella moellendorffii]|uniref:uncharacterized protein LOC112344115 n=1 Tax=Selaginella moellendorffii TaxID=88036 RepID=UPI000D1CB58D|nr:uncharacterized protein LOC112344115 [Selaginella moellendorffii]|eukprot:XP_024523989.1 uncharacterized protein LOC112344115 [Selaginella moellendorffii]
MELVIPKLGRMKKRIRSLFLRRSISTAITQGRLFAPLGHRAHGTWILGQAAHCGIAYPFTSLKKCKTLLACIVNNGSNFSRQAGPHLRTVELGGPQAESHGDGTPKQTGGGHDEERFPVALGTVAQERGLQRVRTPVSPGLPIVEHTRNFHRQDIRPNPLCNVWEALENSIVLEPEDLHDDGRQHRPLASGGEADGDGADVQRAGKAQGNEQVAER